MADALFLALGVGLLILAYAYIFAADRA